VKLLKFAALSLVSMFLLSLAAPLPSVRASQSEPALISILNELGFTNIRETNIETFPAGAYEITLYAEFAAYHAFNELSWYAMGTAEYNVIFSGQEGGFGYVTPPLTKSLEVDREFGLSFLTPHGRYFTEIARNPDGVKHALVFVNLDDPNVLLIGFENTLGGGDMDYQDMVISLKRVPTGDTAPPTSSVDQIEPYWQVEAPFTITATASDDLSGVKSVELWYRYSRDNSTWEPWEKFGVDPDGADGWSWSFTAPEGYGYYEFYSIAVDQAGNVEAVPLKPDAMCVILVSVLPTDQDKSSWENWIDILLKIKDVYDIIKAIQRALMERGYIGLYTALQVYGTIPIPELVGPTPPTTTIVEPSWVIITSWTEPVPEPPPELPPPLPPPPDPGPIITTTTVTEVTILSAATTVLLIKVCFLCDVEIIAHDPTGVEYPLERIPGTDMFILSEVFPQPGVWTFEIRAKDIPANTLFWIYTIHAGISATVDINPDTLNLKSKGKWITAYIELPKPFDVRNIDIDTVVLGTEKGVIRAESDISYGFVKNPEIRDRDGNGLPELMVKFDRQALADIVSTGEQLVKISGRIGETPFLGEHTIRVR